MKKSQTKQYTIRQIPEQVDRTLRRRARESGKSFNQVALEALIQGSGETGHFDDLDFLIGSLSPKEAEAMDEQIRAQRQIDPKLWK